jgi:hypothetical protein
MVLDINPISLSAVQAFMRLTFVSQQTPDFAKLFGAIIMTTFIDDQMEAIAYTSFQRRECAMVDTLLQQYQGEKYDLICCRWND